ncbi:hypothetical protein J2X68_004366 [Streptomyces sp. 3330]|uniref:hypothetical protein n=1 Tax=Streptomyces sp. 3330 TaxID=2817755 RepID=UPI00285B9704|nr:hypothetical protein [Streptomyces sp. 3330]MDR6977647.1 hypothetical protein [Streptomyces sp. 3330]
MITPTDDFDDGPDLDPDDPLTVILRPVPGHLGPPPGRYEAIRRGAVRRRLLRTAAGVGAACGIAALAVLLPLRLTASDAPARPVVPLAPPTVSRPSTPPPPSPSPAPATDRPTEGAATPAPGQRRSTAPVDTAVPTTGRDGRSESPEATTASEPDRPATARPTPSSEPTASPSR